MSELSQSGCEACRADAPRLSPEQIAELQHQVPQWSVETVDGEPRLQRSFKCKDFVAALALANKVAEIAEQQDHHPALLVEWGRLTVSWWTHKINGLHRNDFIMAARTDELQH